MNNTANKRALAWTIAALGGAVALSRFLRSRRAIDFAGKSVLIFGGTYLSNQFRRRRRLSAGLTAGVGALFVGFGIRLATASL